MHPRTRLESCRGLALAAIAAAVLLALPAAANAADRLLAQNPAGPPAPEPAEDGAAPVPSQPAEPAAADSSDENASGGSEATPLDARQENIARRFQQFEKTLLQMAEYLRKTEPDRADLLLRARRKGQEARVQQQMEQIVALLRNDQLGDAVERQAELVKHLRTMLELLQSEDRRSELEKEKEFIQGLLKEVARNIARQKDVRAQTERGAEAGPLADKQDDIADDTGKLVEKIDRKDAERNGENATGKGEQGKEGSGKPGEEKDPKEKQPGDPPQDDQSQDPSDPKKSDPKDPQESQPEESPSKSGEGKSGQGKSGQGKSGQQESPDGKPAGDEESPQQDGSPGESQQQERTPGRDEIEQAKKEMERALEKLKKLNRDGASGHQDEAVRKLLEAKEKLEEILRQLREEERELMLAALEARFQKMLAMQLVVHTGTVGLDKTPKNEWTARHFGRARELSVDQGAIAFEAAKALTLLKEEGSSVAFPEAVEQMRDDMLSVVRLLERTEVGELTQGIQRDIIEVLEEMIEALQKEMEKKKNEQQQQQPGEQGQPGDDELVDKLSELKMLRSLQLRVNRRTKRLGGLVKGEQATDAEVVEQLRSLARRQAQVQQAAHNLATGKNE